MRFLSVCSGIEAASCAWNPLGWKAVAFSEIEPFPCSVLAHHYPDTPNWGDMTKFKDWPDEPIDLLCGGTPCQSFSVAGLRKGLDDPRGNLMLTYGAIAAKYWPKWLVWENVPGVLSSNGGRDFGSFLGLLGRLGYGFAYRVLDAQYFGLAQRRKRVFVVGCLGDWRSAAAVLFERHSLQGHPAPSRETWQRVAPTLDVRAGRSGETSFHTSGGLLETAELLCVATGQASADMGADMAPTLNCNHEAPYVVGVCPTLRAGGNRTGGDRPPGTDVDTADSLIVTHSLRGEGFDASEDGTGRGTPLVPVAATLEATAGRSRGAGTPVGMLQPVAFSAQDNGRDATGDGLTPTMRKGGDGGGVQLAVAFDGQMSVPQTDEELSQTLQRKNPQAVMTAMQVRRLTPVECERLQGFPDDYTLIPHRGKPAADGPRYKALGNSWAVPCAAWIGGRIEAVEAIHAEQRKAA